MELSELTQLNYSEGKFIIIFNQETGKAYRILNEDFFSNNIKKGITGDLYDSQKKKIAEMELGVITVTKFELEHLETEAGDPLENETGEPLELLVQNF